MTAQEHLSRRGSIPAELRERPQWVVWKLEQRDGNPTKVPYRAATPTVRASSTDPTTWTTFELAAQTSAATPDVEGVGFVFAPDDPFAGIDLDDVLDGGRLKPGVAEIMARLRSYTERSPSGNGLHVLVRATLTGERHRTGQTPWGGEFEVYDRGRFFCVTGRRVDATPVTIERRQDELDGLCAEMFPAPAPAPPTQAPSRSVVVSDGELIDRALSATNGDRFARLWRGNTSGHGGDDSAADLALCSHLAFWSGNDAERIDQLFRQSGLMRPKWDERRGGSTYGRQTIRRALEGPYDDHGRAYAHAAGGCTPAPESLPKTTEQPKQSAESPASTPDSAFGGGPSIERTRTERRGPPSLVRVERILDRFDAVMAELGLVGERDLARAVYLVHISRLLEKPGRAVVKGDSATGKSYAVEGALKVAAPEFVWARTSTSALALFYSKESFRHRTLVVYEANKLADDDDDFARILRTLLSEGKLRYEVTDPRQRTSVLLEQEGPVAFISTVARASLDKEVETRILSLHSDGSNEMTENVVRALLNAAAEPLAEPDLSEWHELDSWLASEPFEVVVPWAPTLASFDLSGPPRLRRDITNLLALVRAHALLHRATRSVDSAGRVVATLDDYEVVCELLSEALAIATDKAVRAGTRAIVEAVAALRAEEKTPVSLNAAARKAGRSSSTTHTDVHDALDRGYLVNHSRSNRSFDLGLGDPLPGRGELLPSRADLEARLAGDRSDPVQTPFGERPNAQSPVFIGDSVGRSVRSADPDGDTAAVGTPALPTPPCGHSASEIWRSAGGGPWVCGKCHPPADGLDVEWAASS